MLKMIDMKESQKMWRNYLDTGVRPSDNWKAAGIRDAAHVNTWSLWGLTTAQFVTDVYLWWIITLVIFFCFWFSFSLGKQLPWSWKLQILLAFFTLCLGGPCLQLGHYLLYLEPSHLQIELKHDALYHNYRLRSPRHRRRLHCMELVLGNDRAVNCWNVGSNNQSKIPYLNIIPSLGRRCAEVWFHF